MELLDLLCGGVRVCAAFNGKDSLFVDYYPQEFQLKSFPPRLS